MPGRLPLPLQAQGLQDHRAGGVRGGQDLPLLQVLRRQVPRHHGGHHWTRLPGKGPNPDECIIFSLVDRPIKGGFAPLGLEFSLGPAHRPGRVMVLICVCVCLFVCVPIIVSPIFKRSPLIQMSPIIQKSPIIPKSTIIKKSPIV